ncbi:NADP-dependent oxidoreductase [Streptomyces nojiriensis]|uniref:NADP-dependent oxidoreductase n=1 Tax=Streptomyces nojiriensis TaxID=66374 RepID=UPI0036662688
MTHEARPMMRAVTQDRPGGPEVLRLVETERPSPGPTEILVRVHAAGVNPADRQIRSRGAFSTGATTPFTLGFDVSGVVEAVGRGVTVFRPGDAVFGMPRFPHPAGAYADYVTAPARHFAHRPERLDHIHAAALPPAALTAWQALVDTAGIGPGTRVLIHAAAGGVGHLAVQIAKSRGAYVIGTAREDFAEAVSDVDVVLDAVGPAYWSRSLSTLRPGGTLISIVPPDGTFPAERAHAAGVRAVFMLVEPDQAALRAVASLVDSGRLRVEVDAVVPLAEAARAHALGEGGRTRGKIVLSVVEPAADAAALVSASRQGE